MYQKGEVVWAKIRGFPWWPGIVAKINESRNSSDRKNQTEVLINFIGENSHALLSLDKICKFKDNLDIHQNVKKKKLVASIEIAQKIIFGQSTYHLEKSKLEETTKRKIPNKNNQKINPEQKSSSIRGNKNQNRENERRDNCDFHKESVQNQEENCEIIQNVKQQVQKKLEILE